ncbi:Asp-tRNA(Asn)/Glu-tRNA(Gln) amidotransferase subunit GatB [Spirochaetota bacterium]
MEWEPVIGLEVHTQLNTKSKIFCGCSIKFGAPPNTQTCPVCQAHPGVLPVFNREVLNKAIAAGLALNCTINTFSKFDRKNYFYPDLPKAYQISQFDQPICSGGKLKITVEDDNKSYTKDVRIHRIHMEEDAGKLIHSETKEADESYVDLNRCGTPLLEIVSEPDIASPEEAVLYVQTLRQILLYIKVSDCSMEEGSLRCDANISLRPKGSKDLGVKTEIKNMNSFKGIRAALEYEVNRQTKMLSKGEEIKQETRLFDVENNTTRSMRSKEESHDYRYFPEPDLPPMVLTEKEINDIRSTLPELPSVKKERFIKEYSLGEKDVEMLTADREIAEYFEHAVKAYPKEPKKICNWILTEVLFVLKEQGITIGDFNVPPQEIAEIFRLIDAGDISSKIAKDVFKDMIAYTKGAKEIVKEKGLRQMSDDAAIREICSKVIALNKENVSLYKSGKTQVFGFFMGEIMKATKGQANPKLANKLLKELLDREE